jgi:hypothetical protein
MLVGHQAEHATVGLAYRTRAAQAAAVGLSSWVSLSGGKRDKGECHGDIQKDGALIGTVPDVAAATRACL